MQELKRNKSKSTSRFKCEFCGKTYTSEKWFARHASECEQTARHMNKNLPHVMSALMLFNDWYRIAMGNKHTKTYECFRKSRYYDDFVKFALYAKEMHIKSPEQYLKWLIENQLPLSIWATDGTYNQYQAHMMKRESAERALERYVIHVTKWEQKTGHSWRDYWKKSSDDRILQDVQLGRISPWIIFGYVPASKRLESISDSYLNKIAESIDMEYWKRRIRTNRSTIDWIQQVMNHEK